MYSKPDCIEVGRYGTLWAAGLFSTSFADASKKERKEVRKLIFIECLLDSWPHTMKLHKLCHSLSQQLGRVMLFKLSVVFLLLCEDMGHALFNFASNRIWGLYSRNTS